MAIQDSDPERRNLVLTSLAFIAYFYAGGSFPEASVRLQVINMHFSKPEILGYIAWIAFGWFIYRYWLTHKRSFTSSFCDEFNECRNKYYIINYVNNYFGQEIKPNSRKGEYLVTRIYWQKWRVIIRCDYQMVGRNLNGSVTSTSKISGGDEKPTEFLGLTTIKGLFLSAWATMGCILKKPSFSNYVVPYILAAIALYGAFKNSL